MMKLTGQRIQLLEKAGICCVRCARVGDNLLYYLQKGEYIPAMALRTGQREVFRVRGEKGNEVPGL